MINVLHAVVLGRSQFLNNNTISQFPTHTRSTVVTRYLMNEATILDMMNRVYIADQQARNTATALLAMSAILPSVNATFPDPVVVTPTQEQIDQSLQTVLEPSGECAICQDSISADASQIRQCGHLYHDSCIRNWLSINVRCPVCRHDIREERQEDQTSSASSQSGSQLEGQLEG